MLSRRLFKGIGLGLSVTSAFCICQTSTVFAEDENGVNFADEMERRIREASCWVVVMDRLLYWVGLRKRGEFIMQKAFQSIMDSPGQIFFVGSCILDFGASVLWDSYGQLKLKKPEK